MNREHIEIKKSTSKEKNYLHFSNIFECVHISTLIHVGYHFKDLLSHTAIKN